MSIISSIFDHNTPVSALRAWLSERPRGGRGELKLIAEQLRIPTSVLSQIMAGTRIFSEDHAFVLSSYMGLSALEQDYYLCLVQIERANLHTYKTFLQNRLNSLREKSRDLRERITFEKTLSERSQAEFYSSWLYSAIRMRTSIGKGIRLEEICQEFSLEKSKALQILKFLTEEGLVNFDHGIYTMGPSRTFLDKNSPYTARNHANWRIRAIERSSFLKDEELMFTGTMTLSQKDFLKLKERMTALIQQVYDTVKDSPAETLACLNLDFIYQK